MAMAFFLFMGIAGIVYYFMPVIVWFGLSSLVAFWAVMRKKPKPWLWGVVTGLLIGLPQIWDVILTPFISAYYCKAEAGTWVYKTIPEWQAENPDLPITNMENNRFFQDSYSRHTRNIQKKFFYDQLQVEITNHEPYPMLPFSIVEERLIDVKNQDVLAKRILTVSGDNKNEVKRTQPNPWHISLKPLGLVLIHSNCTPDARGKSWFNFISEIYKTAPYVKRTKQEEEKTKQEEEKKYGELTQLYAVLIETHKQALQYSKDKQKDINELKQWREKVSITCTTNVACLSHYYRTRIESLRAQSNQSKNSLQITPLR